MSELALAPARAPLAHYSGPAKPKMLLVGEAWGESEETCRRPFAGYSGKELWLMLGEAMPGVAPELHAKASEMHHYGTAWVGHRAEWLAAAGIGMTNVLALRPPGNQLEALCTVKKDLPSVYPYGPFSKGKYLRPEYLPELFRLHEEIIQTQPNLIVALGNSACWAVLHSTAIGSIRGAIAPSMGLPNGVTVKVLPTYHPAGVMRNWAWRPIVVADLMKAGREAEFPEIRRPRRQILISPTIEECEAWTTETIAAGVPVYPFLANDIETGAGQIKCIGFARTRACAIVIPFVDFSKPGGSYWTTAELEVRAWRCVEALLSCDIAKLYQNGVYDLQYELKTGIKPKNCTADTMLFHHSLFPELQKGLGFLGSIYTDEPAWKLMNRRKASDLEQGEKLDE